MFMRSVLRSDPLICLQKRQIYDHRGEVRHPMLWIWHAHVNSSIQEGLKAHEGGQGHHANPFDMFANFFGGGRERNLNRP